MSFFLAVKWEGGSQWVGPFATRDLAQEARERVHGLSPKMWVAIVEPIRYADWVKQLTEKQREGG